MILMYHWCRTSRSVTAPTWEGAGSTGDPPPSLLPPPCPWTHPRDPRAPVAGPPASPHLGGQEKHPLAPVIAQVPVLNINFYIYCINPHQLVPSADAADRTAGQCFGFIESGSGSSMLQFILDPGVGVSVTLQGQSGPFKGAQL
jgi:hypothetical protein